MATEIPEHTMEQNKSSNNPAFNQKKDGAQQQKSDPKSGQETAVKETAGQETAGQEKKDQAHNK